MLDYLSKRSTITGVYYANLLPSESYLYNVLIYAVYSFVLVCYYANEIKFKPNLLDQLRTDIREKRRGKLYKGVLLQQDIARVHTCKVAMDAIERNRYELIPHLAWSPDLAPSDFFLFPNLKKDIRRCHFRSDKEVIVDGI